MVDVAARLAFLFVRAVPAGLYSKKLSVEFTVTVNWICPAPGAPSGSW